MNTLNDFKLEIGKIREAVDSLEVKGRDNAAIVVYVSDKCSYMIRELEKVIEQINQNGSINQSEGDDDGKQPN